MIIIWGSRGRWTTLSSGEFNCPQCRTLRPYKQNRLTQYFTLYFIPLFPLRTFSEVVECQVCRGTYKPEVLSYKPEVTR